MKIDKNTTVCISIAIRPGDLGATIFNASFNHLDLNYIYKPFGVLPENLESAINGVRAFGIRGCGVSMPHKIEVMKYLDVIDESAQKIGAINTIVNDDGKLTGYNTDYLGAKKIISDTYNVNNKKVFIIGAGGVSRALIVALNDGGASEITVASRDESKAKQLAIDFNLNVISYDKINEFKADLLINATPVGMSPEVEAMIIDAESLANFSAVMDVVIYPSTTKLMKMAEAKGLVVIPGFKMALYQAAAQFKMYSGQDAPIEIMQEAMLKLYNK